MPRRPRTRQPERSRHLQPRPSSRRRTRPKQKESRHLSNRSLRTHLRPAHRCRSLTPSALPHGPQPQTPASRWGSARRRAASQPPDSSAASANESRTLSEDHRVRIHLVNPSDVSFGTAVITPRWLYVLAAATPDRYGAPAIIDETLEPFDPDGIASGDVVGIGIHTANALRGYHVGRLAHARGAFVVFGGIHATLFPDEVREHGAADAVVTGDGDIVWASVLKDCEAGHPQPHYEGGRIEGEAFLPARWDLLPADRYMWGSVQTVRGCPKHCSFCSVWRTDGQKPRQRDVGAVIREIVALRRKGFRFIVLADDNFYPVPLADLAAADRRADKVRLIALTALRQERFELMAQLGTAARRHGVLHADHHGGGGRSRSFSPP